MNGTGRINHCITRSRRAAIGTTVIVLGIVAIIIVAGIGVLIITNQVNSGGPNQPSPLSNCCLTTIRLQTTQSLPSNFTIAGEIPYLVITPQNRTFTLTYTVTAYNYTLNLSYDQAYSYAVQYSNGTQWLSTSRPCQTGGIGSVPSTNTTYTTTTVITSTVIACGSPNAEWYPVNGTVISPNLGVNASNVQLSIQPTSIPAHATQQIQVKISILMHPGVYAINLGLDIQLPGSSRPVQYLLGYTPLIVKGS